MACNIYMSEKKGKYIERFVKKTDEALQSGIKNADKVIDSAVEIGSDTAKQVVNKGKDIHNKAREEAPKLLKKESSDYTNTNNDDAQSPTLTDIEILEKLANLRDNGVISNDEFNEKKREILDRI